MNRSLTYQFIEKRLIKVFGLVVLLVSFSAQSQQKKGPEVPENPYQNESRELVIEGTEALVKQDGGVVDFDAFAKAESKLRTAISLTPESVPAKYNAGNNYYKNKKWEESTAVLIKATSVAKTKPEKHRAYHNLGNAFYQQKNWDGAVEAYKNALRADPTDEETRYNLQLAKKEKDKNGGGGGDDDKKDENQDQGKDKEKNDKDNKGDGDKKEGDDGKEEETDDEGKEKKDEGEQKEDDKGKPKEQDEKKEGGEGDQKQPPPKPQQGQLSPQRVQSLLKAMQEQEQKTQEKINAQKVKGARVKTEKDW